MNNDAGDSKGRYGSHGQEFGIAGYNVTFVPMSLL